MLTLFRYIPTLVATCCCNAVCIVFATGLGLWMRFENRRRDKAQGVKLRAGQVPTSDLADGEKSLEWRYFL